MIFLKKCHVVSMMNDDAEIPPDLCVYFKGIRYIPKAIEMSYMSGKPHTRAIMIDYSNRHNLTYVVLNNVEQEQKND